MLSMPRSVPHTVRSCQPHSVQILGYGADMEHAPVTGYVWKKVSALMKARGLSAESMSVDKLKVYLGIGRGSVQRIIEGHDNLRADTMAALAKKFGVATSEFAAPANGGTPDSHDSQLITFDDDVIEALSKADNEKINSVRLAVRIALGLPVVAPKKSPPTSGPSLRRASNG